MQNNNLIEEKSLRSENAKIFRSGNGIYHSVITQNKIHYIDSDTGEFEPCNGLLKRFSSGYMTTNGIQKVFWECSDIQRNLVKIQNSNSYVSICFDGLRKNANRISYEKSNCRISANHSRHTNRFETFTINDVYKPSVLFESTDGVNIEYISGMSALMQNIIIHKKRECYVFDFTVVSNDFTLGTNIDNSLILFQNKDNDENSIQYFITSPTLVDKSGNRCNDVYFKVKKLTSTCYRISVIADANWINSESTRLPVIIESSFVYSSFYKNKIGSNIIDKMKCVYNKDMLSTFEFVKQIPEIPNYAKIIGVDFYNSNQCRNEYTINVAQKIQNAFI